MLLSYQNNLTACTFLVYKTSFSFTDLSNSKNNSLTVQRPDTNTFLEFYGFICSSECCSDSKMITFKPLKNSQYKLYSMQNIYECLSLP